MDELLDRERCLLAVIDVQEAFLDRLPEAERDALAARIAWLIRVARALGIPVFAVAEELDANGPPVAAVRAALPEDTTIYDKRVFGMTGQEDIRTALTKSGCDQAVLIGLETDVCVAQSALGLVELGWRVTVPADGCGSPGHDAGLARMAGAGVTISTLKGIYYEWVRDLATHDQVMRAIGRDGPVML